VDSFKFEFLKQVAIFTLKNDLNMLERDVRSFEEAFESNLQKIGVKMIEITAKAKLTPKDPESDLQPKEMRFSCSVVMHEDDDEKENDPTVPQDWLS
jgi:hypothetical protein